MEVKRLTEKLQKKMDSGREYRAMIMDAKPSEDGQYIVEGYASTFNEPYKLWSYDGYTLMEQIDTKAFDKCDMSDVIMQYDHEGKVYARTRNNTLEVTTDCKGLFVRADLSGTEAGRNLYEEIKGGYIDRMSFGFVVGADNRTLEENKVERTVTEMRTITEITKLYDVSAVSIPANDGTSISARSMGEKCHEEVKDMLRKREERERKKAIIRLMMEV